jgi:hypothetical protein
MTPRIQRKLCSLNYCVYLHDAICKNTKIVTFVTSNLSPCSCPTADIQGHAVIKGAVVLIIWLVRYWYGLSVISVQLVLYV